MAFARAGLSKVGGGTGTAPTLWTYTSADAIATVNTSGYFNGAALELRVRDIILVTDSNVPSVNWVIVLSNSAGVVDVSDGTVIAETDGD